MSLAIIFDVLGVQAMVGRALSDAEDTDPGAHPEVVISYALWQGRFHADPAVVGKTIRLGAGRLSSGWGSSGFEKDQPGGPSNRDFLILGVMPPSFIGETVGERPDFWAPLATEEHFLPGRHWLSRRTARWIEIIARLKPSYSLKQAEAATSVLNRQLLMEEEGTRLTEARRRELQQNKIKLLDGSKGFSDLRNQFAKPLWILMAMVCVVLLIACANLANLLLARGTARRREIGTRLALGVDRPRLVRQLMTESFLLSLFGAVLSVPIGWLASRALFTMVSTGNPALTIDLTPDGRVLLFTGTVAILTTLLFGVAPALRSTRVDIHSVLKESERSNTGSRSRVTGEKAVVVTQVALSTTLLFGMTIFYDSQLKFALTVIGVAKDVRDHLVRDQPLRRFYVSYMQPVDGQMGADYEIRSALSPAILDRQIRELVHSVSPRLSIVFIRPLDKSIDNSLLRERLIARLSMLFGFLSLLLGCAGLFGIMAYSVGRRTREIAIRIAVGGQPHNVVWSVVSEALLLVVGGLVIGISVALLLSRYLQSLLFGLKPADGWSIFAVIVTTGLMTLVASIIPARRAARIDPVTALRWE